MNGDRGMKDTLAFALAWTFVLVPMLWGVSQTIVKSMALFR